VADVKLKRRDVFIGTGAAALAATGAVVFGMHQTGSMNDYDVTARTLRRQLPKGVDLRELVRFATLAANGHNTQPWKFRIELSGVDILPDFTRRTGVVDPDDHHLFVSRAGVDCGTRSVPSRRPQRAALY
jgi:hypothetical protein